MPAERRLPLALVVALAKLEFAYSRDGEGRLAVIPRWSSRGSDSHCCAIPLRVHQRSCLWISSEGQTQEALTRRGLSCCGVTRLSPVIGACHSERVAVYPSQVGWGTREGERVARVDLGLSLSISLTSFHSLPSRLLPPASAAGRAPSLPDAPADHGPARARPVGAARHRLTAGRACHSPACLHPPRARCPLARPQGRRAVGGACGKGAR